MSNLKESQFKESIDVFWGWCYGILLALLALPILFLKRERLVSRPERHQK